MDKVVSLTWCPSFQAAGSPLTLSKYNKYNYVTHDNKHVIKKGVELTVTGY